MEELVTKLYNAIHRCHNPQVVRFFRAFCKNNDIVLPETRICKWYNNIDLPCLTSVGQAIQQTRPFQFLFMPPIPEEMNQILNNIHLPDRCIPNLERLLLIFPSFLQKYFDLQDTLLQQSNTLHQPVSYFLAICSSAEFGCQYTIKRFIKRFLEIGGSIDWLKGAYPPKIRNILPLGHLLAYCPFEITKADITPLLSGNDRWTIRELTQAVSIMCFSHMASSFALAHGISSQDGKEIPNVNLAQLQSYNHWRPHKSVFSRFKRPILKHNSEKIERSQSPEVNLQKRISSEYQIDIMIDYTKQINNQMKNNTIYDKIFKAFQHYLPSYKKMTRRNQQICRPLDHSVNTFKQFKEYNFKYNSYPYLKEQNSEIAERILSLIEYSKDMTLIKIGNHETSTVGFRKAIRYYCENLAGYTHQDFNYKTNMNDYFSKQLKFYVKLLSYQPFLIRKEVTLSIPHQKTQLSFFDIMHVSLLVLSTKLQYSMMYFCKVLQSLKS